MVFIQTSSLTVIWENGYGKRLKTITLIGSV